MKYELSADEKTLLKVDEYVETLVIPKSVTNISKYAFYAEYKIKKLDGPNITDIDELTFNMSKIEYINLPNIKYIKNVTFINCEYLKSINIPEAETIKDSAFASCRSIQYINLPKLSKLGYSVFHSCDNLKYISAPLLTEIGFLALYNCDNLLSIDSKLTKKQLIFAFGDNEQQYNAYLKRNRDYKLNMLENEL